MFKNLRFSTFFTKIYKVCIGMCTVPVLQDSCNLEDSRGVVHRTTPSGERLTMQVLSTMFDVHALLQFLQEQFLQQNSFTC